MTEVATRGVRFQISRVARTAAVVSTLVALPLLAGCGESARAGNTGGSEAGDRQSSAERGTDEQKSNAPTTGRDRGANERSKDAEVRADNAAAGARGESDEAPGTNVSEKATTETRDGADRSQEVILTVEGNETKFDGTCSVGDKKRRIGGQAPERYAFSPGGEALRCEIRGEGPGTLNVVLAAGGDVRSVQQSGAGGSEVSLTYTEDRISISQSSSGSGSQVQSTSVSDVSSVDTSAP